MFGGGEAVGVGKGKDDFDLVSLVFTLLYPNEKVLKILRDILCQTKKLIYLFFISGTCG